MINYADYTFYNGVYKGELSEDLFSSLIPKASRQIDKYINREYLIEGDLTDKVRFVACEMVDFLYKNSSTTDSSGKTVSSISIDSVSKTYVTKSTDEINEERADIISGLPSELTRYL